MEWSRIAGALLLPSALWLLTFAVLTVQILLLLLFETRVASGIIDKKVSDYLLAILAVAALFNYDRAIALPLMVSVYPKEAQEVARETLTVCLSGFSILSAVVAFHYSISHVTKFKGRSLLVFPQIVYEKDQAAVRRLWIRIFNLVSLTSAVLLAAASVWGYYFAGILGKADSAVVLLFFVGAVVVGLLAQPLRSLILRYPSSLVLVAKLNQVIAQGAKPREVRRSLSPRKSDPFSWARKELIYVTRILERLARREDSFAGADVSHPVAAIYKAIADHIRLYCSSPKSLEGSLPSSLISTLKATEGFIVTGDSAWRRQLIRQLKVFGADGTARPLATAPASGKTARVARRAVRRTDLALVWIQERWQAIVIVLAVVAFLLGFLDLQSLLGVAK